jgi:hypothetical protein
MDNLQKSQIQKSLFDAEPQNEDFFQASLPTSKRLGSICEPQITEVDQCAAPPYIAQNASRDTGIPLEFETLRKQHNPDTKTSSNEQNTQTTSTTKNRANKTGNTQEQATEINLNKIPGKFLIVSLADLQTLTPAAQSLQKAFGQLSYVAKTFRPLTTDAVTIFLTMHPILVTRRTGQIRVVGGFRSFALVHLIAQPNSKVAVLELSQMSESIEVEFAAADHLITGLYFSLSAHSTRQLLRFFSTAEVKMIAVIKRLMSTITSNKSFEKITGINESTFYRDGEPIPAETTMDQSETNK